MKKLLLFLLTCLSFWAKAQQYPVDCRVSVLAPYSSNFSVYANDPQKFKVSLTLRDLARPSLEVTLRIRLKTAGFILENPLDFISQQSITLLPGITKTFTGRDLADNFSPVNLEGQGIDSYALYRGEALPFGSYEWEVYAVESFRQRQVSNTGLATMHISSNYPPNLNLPSEGAVLTPNFPQNVNFTWSPRQVLASTSIVYTLYLYEIPEGEDALATVNSGAVPFRVVRSTTPYFNYGIQEPALSKGKQYAWQVQVQDFSEKERFENNGFSELRSFRYGQFPCANPMSLLSLPEADGAVRFSWEAVSQAQEYILSYNKLGSSESKRFRTEETSYQVVQLDPKSSYQWSVQSVCSFGDEGVKPSKQSFSFPIPTPSIDSNQPQTAWISDSTLSYDPDDPANNPRKNALVEVDTVTTPIVSPEQQLSDLLNTPITVVSSSTDPLTGESKALPEGVPSTLPTLPENPTVEQLQTALKSKKPTCNGINLPYVCGNHDNVPKYSGSLISVNSGDEIAMNSMIISVVSIDGNGNGDGLIKVPMMGNVKLGLKLEGIKVAEGGCIVEGKANLSGVSLSVLNDKQREEMQKVYVAYKTAISIARENADVIAETINSLSELLENIKQDVSNYVGGVQDAKKMKKNFAGAEHYAKILLNNPDLSDSTRAELKAAYDEAMATKDFFCSGKECQEGKVEPKKGGPFDEFNYVESLCEVNKAKVTKLQGYLLQAEKESSQKIYDFDNKEIIEEYVSKDGETTNNEALLSKNECGEYLMLLQITSLGSPSLGIPSSSTLVPPKGKKPASSQFSEIELYQYVLLREMYSEIIDCKTIAFKSDYYIDAKYNQAKHFIRAFLTEDSYMGSTPKVNSEIRDKIIVGLFGNQQVDAVKAIKKYSNFNATFNAHTILDFARKYAVAELGGRIVLGTFAKIVNQPLIKSLVGRILSKFLPNVEKVSFYSVQSAEDALRLKNGGLPWPTGPTQAHLGPGLYSWATKAEAESYLALKVRRNPNLKLQIVEFEIEASTLSKLKTFKVPLDDDLADAWLEKYSSLGKGKGLPHGYQYIQGNAGIATEHYFSSDIFHFFKTK